MTSPAAPLSGPPAARGVRRAYRELDDGVLGGVASGLALHLGVPALVVRVFFVVSAAVGGLGVALYAAFWVMLPARQHFEHDAPGLEGARRDGRRAGRLRSLGDAGPLLVLGVLGIGVVLAVQALLGRGAILWPLAIAGVGLALLWRQADEAQRERWLDSSGRVDPSRVILGDGGWAAYARLGAGGLLIVSAMVIFSLRGGSFALARDVTAASLIGVAGILLVVGPWVFRLASELTSERSERIRTQERADMAAHLHDSVLQTLALIQNNSGDATQVARLARAQERDLRSWLYAGEEIDESTVARAVRAAAAEVEDAHGVSVDVVAVGDHDFEECLRPIIAATREAIANSAQHSGTGRVDVYAEITEHEVEVFVRDRGPGFVVEQVPLDRLGVRNSILGRMERHGGTAEIRSAPGTGTEVRLRLPLGAAKREHDRTNAKERE